MGLELLIFDLDGVLFDSAPLVVDAVKRSITKFSMEVDRPIQILSESLIEGLLGLPNDEYVRALGFTQDDEEVEIYKAFLLSEEIELIRQGKAAVYEGMRDALRWFYERNIDCVVASNCRHGYMLEFLEKSELERYFEFSLCNDDVPRGGDKAQLLSMVCEHQQVLPSEAVYLGDRSFDEQAARSAGTGFIGCLWGYGEGEGEFSQSVLTCKKPSELMDIVERLLKAMDGWRDDKP